MNERELARKITCHLDRGLGEIRMDTHHRLAAARRAALSLYGAVARQTPVWAWAGAARGFFQNGRRVLTHYAMVAALLIASAIGIAYWENATPPGEQDADVEISLLTGELPINAYLDSGFDAWLKHSSQ
jgi:hypothetical protein